MSKWLQDLAVENSVYVHGTGVDAPRPTVDEVVSDADVSAYRVALGPGLTEGLPVRSLDRCTPADLDVDLDEARTLDSCRPDWATLSFNPRSASGPSVSSMKRMNGRPMRPEFVHPPVDDRSIFYPNTWPWILAGRVEVKVAGAPFGTGTGALVGTNVVVTASHLIPWFLFPLCTIKFTPGYFYGASVLGKGVSSYCYEAKGYHVDDAGHDFAVLRLAIPLGNNDALGYFGYRTYSDDWEGLDRWTLIGYPGVMAGIGLHGEFPTRQSGIFVLDDDSDGAALELEHSGDTTDGNSGGPLWGWFDNSPRIIGVHSGSAAADNIAAGGAALTALIKWARDNW